MESGARKEDIYTHIYIHIFAVCQKSVHVIHRNRRSSIRWGHRYVSVEALSVENVYSMKMY